jgi:hypothetical protein
MLRRELGSDSVVITALPGGGCALLSDEGVVIVRLPETIDVRFYQSI